MEAGEVKAIEEDRREMGLGVKIGRNLPNTSFPKAKEWTIFFANSLLFLLETKLSFPFWTFRDWGEGKSRQ